ncbi:uncharacterized protein PgNI_04667, partial [Pyricularia grisea]|uniref:Uncharacterized protein n=1 Tax=Pyricularia grisea TaxID=148305 RepID=A0A6P8BA81_PYRGI
MNKKGVRSMCVNSITCGQVRNLPSQCHQVSHNKYLGAHFFSFLF